MIIIFFTILMFRHCLQQHFQLSPPARRYNPHLAACPFALAFIQHSMTHDLPIGGGVSMSYYRNIGEYYISLTTCASSDQWVIDMEARFPCHNFNKSPLQPFSSLPRKRAKVEGCILTQRTGGGMIPQGSQRGRG